MITVIQTMEPLFGRKLHLEIETIDKLFFQVLRFHLNNNLNFVLCLCVWRENIVKLFQNYVREQTILVTQGGNIINEKT